MQHAKQTEPRGRNLDFSFSLILSDVPLLLSLSKRATRLFLSLVFVLAGRTAPCIMNSLHCYINALASSSGAVRYLCKCHKLFNLCQHVWMKNLQARDRVLVSLFKLRRPAGNWKTGWQLLVGVSLRASLFTFHIVMSFTCTTTHHKSKTCHGGKRAETAFRAASPGMLCSGGEDSGVCNEECSQCVGSRIKQELWAVLCITAMCFILCCYL